MYHYPFRLNYFNDLASVMIGFYKGAMDAHGVHADLTPVVGTLLGTSLLRGAIGANAARIHNKDPFHYFNDPDQGKTKSVFGQGAVHGGAGLVISSLEMSLGYGAGWTLGKML